MTQANKNKKISSVKWSERKNNFKSHANWSQADWDHEWDSWMRDVTELLNAANQETFTPQSWKILNVIQATAQAARRDNDMPKLRDALQRYRQAARQFLGLA